WAAFDLVHSPSAAVEEGNAKMKAGKADEALTAYDKAVAELPNEPGAHFNRGTALAALSRFDEAGEEFLRATEAKDPALKASAFYNLGNAFAKKEKFQEAIEAYKRSLALNPKDERAKWNLEIALKKKREDDKKKQDDKKDQDKQDKDKQDQKKDDKKDQSKKDDKKDQDQKKDEPQKDQKDQKNQDQQKQPNEKPPAEREIESMLDNLEKSPKDLEKQRAQLRAVRRAPPARDW
ncbi:MAG TPA: tetratricopeptide repeat protein, partial [Polyangia bacterium]|nr:tetratricopeptide repeat protein [Polyangia bacterium]